MNTKKTYASVVLYENPKKPIISKPFCKCCRKEVQKTIWYEYCNLDMCQECISFKEYYGFV